MGMGAIGGDGGSRMGAMGRQCHLWGTVLGWARGPPALPHSAELPPTCCCGAAPHVGPAVPRKVWGRWGVAAWGAACRGLGGGGGDTCRSIRRRRRGNALGSRDPGAWFPRFPRLRRAAAMGDPPQGRGAAGGRGAAPGGPGGRGPTGRSSGRAVGQSKERMKEGKEKDARYTNGHLFTTITVSGMTMCFACNKSITAKEALICPSERRGAGGGWGAAVGQAVGWLWGGLWDGCGGSCELWGSYEVRCGVGVGQAMGQL